MLQDNSTFTASLFNIVFTPENNSLALNVVGDSSTEGNVTLYVKAAAYGYQFLSESLNPCEQGLTRYVASRASSMRTRSILIPLSIQFLPFEQP